MITFRSGLQPPRFLHQLAAVHARQAQIGEQDVDVRILLQQRQRLGAVARFRRRKADLLDHVHRGHADQRHIFHHQHLAAPLGGAAPTAGAAAASAPRAVPAKTLRSLRASSSLR